MAVSFVLVGTQLVVNGYYMRETGWSPICCGRRFLRGVFDSTRGPRRTDLWCTCCRANGIAG